MRVHGTQTVEVVIDPINIINKLLGDLYTTSDGKLMSGDGGRFDIEIISASSEQKEYYQSLEKVKNYLTKSNVIINKDDGIKRIN